jgi:hypothetical protein
MKNIIILSFLSCFAFSACDQESDSIENLSNSINAITVTTPQVDPGCDNPISIEGNGATRPRSKTVSMYEIGVREYDSKEEAMEAALRPFEQNKCQDICDELKNVTDEAAKKECAEEIKDALYCDPAECPFKKSTSSSEELCDITYSECSLKQINVRANKFTNKWELVCKRQWWSQAYGNQEMMCTSGNDLKVNEQQ